MTAFVVEVRSPLAAFFVKVVGRIADGRSMFAGRLPGCRTQGFDVMLQIGCLVTQMIGAAASGRGRRPSEFLRVLLEIVEPYL